jgi:site-specific recombinase XerD
MFQINDYLSRLEEYYELKNYTSKTRENYTSSLKCYLYWLNENDILPEQAEYEHIRAFVHFLRVERKLAIQTINYYISKVRFFQIYLLNKSWNPYQVPFSKFDSKLPETLTHDEAILFLNTLPNLKDKAICALMYGSGLRVSEARNLRYSDISRSNLQIYIRKSKSRSARYAILPKLTLDILTEYWKVYGKPTGLLFPNRNGVHPISTQIISTHFKIHGQRLGWSKTIYPHMFRHSFALNLYNNGYDLLTIQKLLGHKSIASTTIYVNLSDISKLNVTSPVDWI